MDDKAIRVRQAVIEDLFSVFPGTLGRGAVKQQARDKRLDGGVCLGEVITMMLCDANDCGHSQFRLTKFCCGRDVFTERYICEKCGTTRVVTYQTLE